AELGAVGRSAGGVTLRVHAVLRAVLPALPGDDEVAVVVHRHARGALHVAGKRVDLELAALRDARRVVAPRVDAVDRSVLPAAGPGDDEVAHAVGGDGGVVLLERGKGVDAELA